MKYAFKLRRAATTLFGFIMALGLLFAANYILFVFIPRLIGGTYL